MPPSRRAFRPYAKFWKLPTPISASRWRRFAGACLEARERFRKLPVEFDGSKPLIGVVGEIFCRLNEFSNNELVRRLEVAGAEVWMNDFSEWIWYTNADQHRRLQIFGRRFSMEAAEARIRNYVQRKDEHNLAGDVQGRFPRLRRAA